MPCNCTVHVLGYSSFPLHEWQLSAQAGKVMEADKSVLEILTKVTPYKVAVCLTYDKPLPVDISPGRPP